MTRWKTLHLTNAYHAESGGIRAVYHSLLDAAPRLQRLVRLVVPGPSARVDDVNSHARIYVVPAPRAWVIDRRCRLIMPWQYLAPTATCIQTILRAERPDIVEVCDKHSLPYLAGVLRASWIPGVGRPTVIGTSAERFDDSVRTFLSEGRAAGAFARWFIRHVYMPLFDYHIANSEYTAEELLTALPAHRQDIVHIVPPGVATQWFAPSDAAAARAALVAQMGGDARTKLLVYVGRLSPEKNIPLLAQTLDRLVAGEQGTGITYRLLIAGSGPSVRMLEAAAFERPGRIRLLGPLFTQTLVKRVLTAADVFVHPNPREPFGLAPLEVMAVGCPVVVPDRGGVLTYADRTTAWLAAPTPEAFAAAIADAVHDVRSTRARVAAARARAATFTDVAFSSRFFRLLDELHASRMRGQAAAPAVPGCAASL